ncbi:hypothetical protein ACQCSX_04145 [Pseudarthrobacter sp. P1]|uniref:hypothetical protein n=1 Tax=Pseudarthrobacter sp. P1 TaxID=3418418 RepID=UPI003CEDD79C
MSAQGGLPEITQTNPPDFVRRRSASMHLEGHRYYASQCPDGCDRVNKWAATRLIAPRPFMHAARAHGTINGIASELWVTPVDVIAYISALDPDEWLTMRLLVGYEIR